MERAASSATKSLDPKNPNAQAEAEAKKTGELIDFKAINYLKLIPIMIKGMQEQSIKDLKQINQAQQQQIDELKQLVQTLVSSGSTPSFNLL